MAKKKELRQIHKRILVVMRYPKAFFQVSKILSKGARQVAPRISELVSWGYLIDTGKKRITRYGRPARVYKKAA